MQQEWPGNEARMTWEWGKDDLGMRQGWPGNEARMTWEWGKNDLGMRQGWPGNEARMTWEWGKNDLGMRLNNCYTTHATPHMLPLYIWRTTQCYSGSVLTWAHLGLSWLAMCPHLRRDWYSETTKKILFNKISGNSTVAWVQVQLRNNFFLMIREWTRLHANCMLWRWMTVLCS